MHVPAAFTLGPLQHAENVYAAGLSPNGKWIVAAAGVAIVVWEASSASRLGDPLPRLSLIDPLRFTPNGKRIITRGRSRIVAWDIPAQSISRHRSQRRFASWRTQWPASPSIPKGGPLP
jgi:hypothetical protein